MQFAQMEKLEELLQALKDGRAYHPMLLEQCLSIIERERRILEKRRSHFDDVKATNYYKWAP